PRPYLPVNKALVADSDPLAPRFARTTTSSPGARAFDVDLISVTRVLGGTVTCCEPPAYCTTSDDPFAFATLPFDMRAGDAVPFVMREPDTAPLVMRFPPPLALGVIMRLPSPRPRSASGKM